MNRIYPLAFFVVAGALLGLTTYGQPSVLVGVGVPLPSVEVVVPSVEIHAESDFYEPLTPYGRWEVVGSYGRCWIPGHVEADWRPYSDGYWQRTDAGWYWTSDEPWAWATYHYGRWDLNPEYGWFWVPQTQWAPAWVSWHEGGGYVGWAPLYPSDVRVISPRAYVFVQERHFTDPVRRSTVIVDNTVLITKTVINNGPTTVVIEKATGRKVQAVAVGDLRRKSEAAVVLKERAPASNSERKVQTPVSSGARPVANKIVAARAPAQDEQPAVKAHVSAESGTNPSKAQGEKLKAARSAEGSQPEAKPEANHPPAILHPSQPKAGEQIMKQEKAARPPVKKAQRSAKANPAASGNGGPNAADNARENKPRE